MILRIGSTRLRTCTVPTAAALRGENQAGVNNVIPKGTLHGKRGVNVVNVSALTTVTW